MEFVPSPNFWEGRRGQKPLAIVIHMTAGSFDGAKSWLTNKKSQVSAHYLIGKNGNIIMLVEEKNAAWHAGRVLNPTWRRIIPNINPNLYTIGIEHENINGEPMTPAQWRASTALIAEICERWNIQIDNDHIIKHKSIFGLKSCPGNGIPIGA